MVGRVGVGWLPEANGLAARAAAIAAQATTQAMLSTLSAECELLRDDIVASLLCQSSNRRTLSTRWRDLP